jgi:hypothetical protein
LQEALDDIFLNDGNTVQCPMVGCSGQQTLKIGIEKMPAILVIDVAATVNKGHIVNQMVGQDLEMHLEMHMMMIQRAELETPWPS